MQRGLARGARGALPGPHAHPRPRAPPHATPRAPTGPRAQRLAPKPPRGSSRLRASGPSIYVAMATILLAGQGGDVTKPRRPGCVGVGPAAGSQRRKSSSPAVRAVELSGRRPNGVRDGAWGTGVSSLRHSSFLTPALFLSFPDSFLQCAPRDTCGAKTDLSFLSSGPHSPEGLFSKCGPGASSIRDAGNSLEKSTFCLFLKQKV